MTTHFYDHIFIFFYDLYFRFIFICQIIKYGEIIINQKTKQIEFRFNTSEQTCACPNI